MNNTNKLPLNFDGMKFEDAAYLYISYFSYFENDKNKTIKEYIGSKAREDITLEDHKKFVEIMDYKANLFLEYDKVNNSGCGNPLSLYYSLSAGGSRKILKDADKKISNDTKKTVNKKKSVKVVKKI